MSKSSHHPLCVQINAFLHPVRLRMPRDGEHRILAEITVGDCIVLEVRTPVTDARAGLILKPQFTVAHRLYEVIVAEAPEGSIRGYGNSDPFGMKYTAKELLVLVQTYVAGFMALHPSAGGNPVYCHPWINQQTNLLLPEHRLDD